MGCSLSCCNANGMSQQQKLHTAWQLAKAVQQLHDRHMLSLDIKPSTVLLDGSGDVVLSGLGTLCQMLADSQSLPSSHGTDIHRSCDNTQLNGARLQRSADVRSLAYTILYMFTQTLPFEHMSSIQIGDALQAGQIPAIPHRLPVDLQRMLQQCFTWPCTRSTATLMALKLQAMMEDTSVCPASDTRSGMPFSARASSRQPNPALMTGRSATVVAAAGQEVAALANLVLQLQSNGHSSQEKAAKRVHELASVCHENKRAIIAAGAMPPLVALLRANEPAVQQQAAWTLHRLAAGPRHIQRAI